MESILSDEVLSAILLEYRNRLICPKHQTAQDTARDVPTVEVRDRKQYILYNTLILKMIKVDRIDRRRIAAWKFNYINVLNIYF